MLLLSPVMKVNKGWVCQKATIKYKCYAIGLFHAFRSNSFLAITFKAQQPQSSSLWGKIQNLSIFSPSYIILYYIIKIILTAVSLNLNVAFWLEFLNTFKTFYSLSIFCYAFFNSFELDFRILFATLALTSEVEMYSQFNYKEHTTQVTIHCDCIEKSITDILQNFSLILSSQKKN